MDISPITESLYVGAQPEARDYDHLCALGVRLIICMRAERRPPAALSRPPLSVLWLRTYDICFLPIPVGRLEQGARAALEVIGQGGRVLAHCQRGRHRGPAMGAAILIAQGHSAEAAMALVRARRPVAHPQAWYVRRQILRFEQHWGTSEVPPC